MADWGVLYFRILKSQYFTVDEGKYF